EELDRGAGGGLRVERVRRSGRAGRRRLLVEYLNPVGALGGVPQRAGDERVGVSGQGLDRDVAQRIGWLPVGVGVQGHVTPVRVAALESELYIRREIEAGEPVGRRLLREVEVAPVESLGRGLVGRDRTLPEAGC